jgi:integrase
MTREQAEAEKDKTVKAIASADAIAEQRESIETVYGLGDAWVSGELFRKFGAVNGLKLKTRENGRHDGYKLKNHIGPIIGHMRVADVTEEDIDRVIASIDAKYAANTRLQIYLALHRLFDLAIAPARLRKDNPVTSHHRPSLGAMPLFGYLYPDEFLALMACERVPFERKVFYALAVYTGLRKSTIYSLVWKDFDTKHGTLLALVVKNGVPQLFELQPVIVRLLRQWHKLTPRPEPDDPIIRRRQKRHVEAGMLRDDLLAAGVKRDQLHVDRRGVSKLRFHDLRATFVTWAKRAGRGDGWISDRTGHLTAAMITRYTRAARTLQDLKMVPFPDFRIATGAIAKPTSSRTQGREASVPSQPRHRRPKAKAQSSEP